MSCKYDSITLEDLGIHVDQICEERVTEIIYELAEAFRLPVQILTSDEVKEAAEETYLGIHPEHRETLLHFTMEDLAKSGTVDTSSIAEMMQNVAARHQLATVED
ncbi:hypothetical protein [Glutamicibacter nicotianae]|uniref:hypothetical protein n=1 Tax=Glutamicibacter nicotianae TaxID=37929 RepID=UPI00167F645E|nr:hypothetical protein [Glutamicibacter nicotianae]